MSDISSALMPSLRFAFGRYRRLCGDSTREFKYSLAYIVAGKCALCYDNEPGKGDHKHIDTLEVAYHFTTPAQLLADFWSDVDRWMPK
jgi:hypothetical protein